MADRFARVACSAGNKPHNMVAPTPASAAKASARQPNWNPPGAGSVVNTLPAASTSQSAIAQPNPMANAAISRISRITSPRICVRVAPMELRMAISRSRCWSCVSINPAMLATAMSSSMATAPKINSRVLRYSPTRASFRLRTTADQPLSVCGNCSPSWRCTRARSSCACAILTPGCMRPTPE